jgi:uncharacterized protein YndB with AHSA1/START domain
MERELGYSPPPGYIFDVLSDKLGHELWPKLTNAGRHTIDLKMTQERRYDFNGDCEEHRLEADLCPVTMRRIEMMSWEPPWLRETAEPLQSLTPPPPPEPPPQKPEPLLHHAWRSLTDWCREMCSEVVYDGPT